MIARPFVGAPGHFTRTSNRHDYALSPLKETLLDRLKASGVTVVAIGKIEDLFAGKGINRAIHTCRTPMAWTRWCGRWATRPRA